MAAEPPHTDEQNVMNRLLKEALPCLLSGAPAIIPSNSMANFSRRRRYSQPGAAYDQAAQSDRQRLHQNRLYLHGLEYPVRQRQRNDDHTDGQDM